MCPVGNAWLRLGPWAFPKDPVATVTFLPLLPPPSSSEETSASVGILFQGIPFGVLKIRDPTEFCSASFGITLKKPAFRCPFSYRYRPSLWPMECSVGEKKTGISFPQRQEVAAYLVGSFRYIVTSFSRWLHEKVCPPQHFSLHICLARHLLFGFIIIIIIIVCCQFGLFTVPQPYLSIMGTWAGSGIVKIFDFPKRGNILLGWQKGNTCVAVVCRKVYTYIQIKPARQQVSR
ncbi:hypothetical protein BZA77DRAFT_301198 [Pyronema omphalodes]|nr:hypothetical protein BZA77DRAFT_301198 [Pyronema omphalodes]